MAVEAQLGDSGAGEGGDPDHHDVQLRIPADAEFLRLARYAAADAATRAGMDMDGIDDLRLALSELCSLLTGSETPIMLRFEARDGAVTVHGSGAPGPEIDGENGELARTLVEAVVDDFRFEVLDGRASFRVVKEREQTNPITSGGQE